MIEANRADLDATLKLAVDGLALLALRCESSALQWAIATSRCEEEWFGVDRGAVGARASDQGTGRRRGGSRCSVRCT